MSAPAIAREHTEHGVGIRGRAPGRRRRWDLFCQLLDGPHFTAFVTFDDDPFVEIDGDPIPFIVSDHDEIRVAPSLCSG